MKLRHNLFLVVDAKLGFSGDWINTVEGPTGVELVKATADTAIDASLGSSYLAFEKAMDEWRDALVRWRCGLSAADRARFSAPAGWNCRDLKIFVGRVGFDQLDAERAAMLDRIPTRFSLPPDQVDAVIAAGGAAMRSNPTVRAFAASL